VIRWGHPVRGVVDYGPANGRRKSVGSGPGGVYRTPGSRTVITGHRVATPPSPPLRATGLCCGHEVVSTYPCPVCGRPFWPERIAQTFGYPEAGEREQPPPCEVCGRPCVWTDAEGRRVHPKCAQGETRSNDDHPWR
jgi:hypothetical protein